MRTTVIVPLLLVYLGPTLSQEVLVKMAQKCSKISTMSTVEFQSIEVDKSCVYNRVHVRNSVFNPTVEKNFNSSSFLQCAFDTCDEKLNSFSYEDGNCTGYSFWIPTSSKIILPTATDSSKLIYLASSQLTEYIENEALANITLPKIQSIEWKWNEGGRFPDINVQLNISSSYWLAESVVFFVGDFVYRNFNGLEIGPTTSLDISSFAMCSYDTAHFKLIVDGKYGESIFLRTNVSAEIANPRFTDFNAGNMSYSTFKFDVKGDVDEVGTVFYELFGSQDGLVHPISALPGYSNNYTILYSPPGTEPCYSSSPSPFRYEITLKDKFKCTLDTLQFDRNLCCTGYEEGTDYCSHCVFNIQGILDFISSKAACTGFAENVKLLPKVDSGRILEILSSELISEGADPPIAWLDYTLVDGIWKYGDNSTEIDANLLDVTEFEGQPDSVGGCSAIQVAGNAFKLSKKDCSKEAFGLCFGTPGSFS